MTKYDIVNSLMEILGKSDEPLKFNELSKILRMKSDTEEYDIMKESVNELVSNGIVKRLPGRKFILNETDTLSTAQGVLRFKHDQGIVSCNIKYPQQKGKKVILVNKEVKVVVKRKFLKTALDGDTVQIKLLAEKKGKKIRGEVLEVISRQDRLITGTLETDGEFNFLIPDDDIYYIDFLIPSGKLKGAVHGDKVSARFVSWTDQQKSPVAEVFKIIGKAHRTESGYDSVADEFSLPETFRSEVLTETNQIFKKFNENKSEIKNRLDLRNEIIITIDPPDAKDFDDALSLKLLENGNYQLGVHIADVSYYVNSGSETDKEAYKRGTSVYLVDRVVPMLPELISNEICSLKPDVERMTYSVIMEVNKYGTVKDYSVVETVIKSKKRFSYDEVLEIINNQDNIDLPGDKITQLVLELNKLAKLLRRKRFEKGGVDFDTAEVKFQLDENKKPIKAIVKRNNDATSLVEECMLLANKTATEHIYNLTKQFGLKKTLPFLYRVHESPDEEKMKQTFKFLRLLTKEKAPQGLSSKQLNAYLKLFKDSPQKSIVHQMIVRSMPKAEYTAENIGHFGLGFSRYTHFTSPIRRYPDLVVHRILKEYNSTKSFNFEKTFKMNEYFERAGKQSTERERVAMEAERASVKYAQALLASDLSGEIMMGTISGVTNFGIFVTMDDIFAEGLVHIRDLDDDYYIFDESNYRLFGKVNRRIYQFGDRVEVQIVKSNLEKRKIELRIPRKSSGRQKKLRKN